MIPKTSRWLALTAVILSFALYFNFLLVNYFLGHASDTVFYTGELVIKLCLSILTIYVLKQMGKQDLFQIKKPVLAHVGLVIVCFVINAVCNVIKVALLPVTQNQEMTNEVLGSGETFAVATVLILFVGPLYEELIFRGLVMA